MNPTPIELFVEAFSAAAGQALSGKTSAHGQVLADFPSSLTTS
jgi:hypothetical protein